MGEQFYKPLTDPESMPELPEAGSSDGFVDNSSILAEQSKSPESLYSHSSSSPVPPWSCLTKFRYTEAEAQFLYVVATHSGYFTLAQFLRFHGKSKGWASHHFTEKLLSRRHANAFEYGRKTLVFHLHNQGLYDMLGRNGLRHCRRHTLDQIRTRLMILDFVLAHPQHRYIETEAEKVDYFHRILAISMEFFPKRRFRKPSDDGPIRHYFLDGFPIFLPRDGGSGDLPGLASAVTFTYCDSGKSLDAYAGHLRAYAPLLCRLPAFNFIFASPRDWLAGQAASLFEQLFEPRERVDTVALERYFRLRDLWEGQRSGSVTRAERDELRAGMRRFDGKTFESLYSDWQYMDLTPDELRDRLNRDYAWPPRLFHAVPLPDDYAILKPRHW